MYGPGTGNQPGFPELNADSDIAAAAVDQLGGVPRGRRPGGRAAPRHQLQLQDRRLCQAGAGIGAARPRVARDRPLRPAGLARIRRFSRTPIASLESIYGRRQFRPYFENQSVDYAIVDVAWNGILESVKIANMADSFEVNCAPHNFNGHLGSLISAHFCAAIPNFKVMEIDIDDVTWKDDIVTRPPVIENGDLLLPTGPGWGADVNEEFVRAHPPKR